MAEREPDVGSESWFKELRNRLERVEAKLADAAIIAGRSERAGAAVDRHLSILQELIATIEDRVARLSATAADGAPGRPESVDGVDAVLYRDIPDFSGYRVGNDGSIWSSRTPGRGYGRTRDWHPLKPYLVRPGPVLMVSLYRERVRHPTPVDALVLLTFVGSCPEQSEVVHLNGNPIDNRLDNLRYVASLRSA